MTPKLLIHSGLPKTGTTTIQLFCSINREKLKEHGWLYPVAGCQHRGHHSYANFFRKQPLDWVESKDPQTIFDSLVKEIEKSGCKNVIISSEALFYSDRLEKFKKYFDGFDVHMLLFLRRQDDWIESTVREQMKNGAFHGDPIVYVGNRMKLLDYDKKLRAWEKTIGKDAIHLGIFEPKYFQESLEAIFMRHLGLELDSEFKIPGRRNHRLNRAALDFIVKFSDSRRLGEDFHQLKSVLENYSRQRPDDETYRYILPPGLRLEVADACRAGNERIARDYFNTTEEGMFRDRKPSPDDPWEPYPGIGTDEMMEIARAMWRFHLHSARKSEAARGKSSLRPAKPGPIR